MKISKSLPKLRHYVKYYLATVFCFLTFMRYRQCVRRNYFFWGGTAERRNYSALAWRNTKTIDIFNFEDGEMRALQRRIF